jgi:hypothetical protein
VVTAARTEAVESEALEGTVAPAALQVSVASEATRAPAAMEEAVASIPIETAETVSDSQPRPATTGIAEAMTAVQVIA